MRQKIIFFDIEGGHGGSSRSLYYTLKNLSFKKFDITVACKKDSWIKSKYLKKGIKCEILNDMPCFSSLKGYLNNILLFVRFILIVWPKFYWNRKIYKKIIQENEIIHLNQISLVFFGLWIKKNFPNKIITMHIRTMPYINFFSWLKIYLSEKICKKFIFITKKEKQHMEKILNKNIKGDIILNPNPDWKSSKKKISKKINIASLSNYDFERGTDRIIEVVSLIPLKERKKFIFHMIGDYKKKNKIKNLFSKKNNLLDYSKKLNVKNNFIFYGHKSFPENILTNCQYLIKLTREDNPWGRDIIEAIYLGLGIIATGQKSDLIKNNLNGFLLKKYDPKKISKLLLKIDKKIIKKHQKNSKELSNKLFNNKILKIQFENFWKQFSKKT